MLWSVIRLFLLSYSLRILHSQRLRGSSAWCARVREDFCFELCFQVVRGTRTADSVGSIHDDVKISTANETSCSVSRRTTDSVVVTRDTVSRNVIIYGTSPPHHPTLVLPAAPRMSWCLVTVCSPAKVTVCITTSRLDLAGRGLAQYPMNNFTKQGYARAEILQEESPTHPAFFFSAISVSSCSRPVPLTTPQTELPRTIHRRTRNADQ